jgi:phytoene dehydrogenase-like protein
MYDTIVIGNDVSSLVAATLMAHHGGKTVLLSEGDNQYVYTESGYTFPIDPFPLTGFGPEQICTRLFSSLGAQCEEIPDPRLQKPCFQIILPNHRIDFFNDKERLLKEMQREFAVHGEDIRRMYISVSKIYDFFEQWIRKNPYFYPCNYKELITCMKNIPGLIKERLQLSKSLQAIKKNPSLYRVFEAQMAVFSNYVHGSQIHSNLLTAYIFSFPFRGIYYHANSKESLMRSLRSMFIKSGGHWINNCSVNNVSMRKEINVDIDSYDRMSTIRGRYLITSTKWEKFSALLLNNRKFRRLKRKLKSLQPLYYPFTLHMGVYEKCIPEMMASYSVILGNHDNAKLYNNIVFLESSFCGETERAPSGKRALSVSVFLKESPLTMSDVELTDISTSIFQSLDAFLPFLKENIDYINVGKSIEIAKKYQGLVNLKYSMDTASFFGLHNISHKTPVHNVFITGGMLLAGLGFEGEILSGVNAAKAVIEQEE